MNANLHTLLRAGWLRRADAALGEWVARAFPESAPEVGLAAALAGRAIGEGHSALQLDAAQAWLGTLEGQGDAPMLPDPAAWRAALRASGAVHDDRALNASDAVEPKPLVLDAQGRVYLTRYFDYERRLAQQLIARALPLQPLLPDHSAHAGSQAPPPIPASGGRNGQGSHSRFSPRITLITGGPGTGKTHGVVRMLASLATEAHANARTLRIALAAPTGKAAARLAISVRAQLPLLALPGPVTAMIPQQAHTLHRLLGLSPVRTGAKFDRTAPLPYDVVVVDEVSMVDLPMMHKLVDAVAPAVHLILLGDPDQLAAVEAGDVLGALVEAARTPPLAACHTHLVHSRRFAEHGALGQLANAIAQGDAEAALAALGAGEQVCLLASEAQVALPLLLDRAVDEYRAVLDAADAPQALLVAERYRVLTARRFGPAGCVALNRAIEQQLKRHAGVRADAAWWQGRLLMVTANRPDLALFNGDVGVIWPDAHKEMKVCFGGADGALRALSPAALPPHEGAFALTVHKAQGSEFDRVALVLGADSPVLTRELLYTGITRARNSVHIYGDAALLQAGIARRTQRWNGLADRLREVAAAPTSLIAESLPDSQ